MSGTFAALKVRNYRIYAAGTLISNVGTWMQRVAQDWLVLVVTGSAGALGITTGLQFLPTLLFSAFAGVLADRFPKRLIMVIAQVCMGVTALALGLLALTEAVEVWHIYVLAFLFGTASAFEIPARQTFVHELVDRSLMPNAVGLNSASFNLARMLGPAAAGGLIALFGSGERATGWVILINAASYVAVLLALYLVRTGELQSKHGLAPSKGGLAESVAYVRSRPDIMMVMAVVFFCGTFGLNFQLTTALMATQVYGKGAGEYGLLGSIVAVGSLVGSLLAAGRKVSRQRLVVVAAVVFGLTEILAGIMPSYLAFALVLPLCGITALTTVTAANALIQISTDPAMRGRVMALYMMIFMGGTPFGAPLLGYVSDHFGARWTLIGGGAVTAIGASAAGIFFGRRQGVTVRARWSAGPHLDFVSRGSNQTADSLASR